MTMKVIRKVAQPQRSENLTMKLKSAMKDLERTTVIEVLTGTTRLSRLLMVTGRHTLLDLEDKQVYKLNTGISPMGLYKNGQHDVNYTVTGFRVVNTSLVVGD